jgi:hypothetical protein
LASESGQTFFLNLVGGFNVVLPAVAAGLHYTFIVKLLPTTAYTITPTDADSIVGTITSSQDAGGSADSAQVGDQGDALNFVASKAAAGDMAEFWSDGTVWYVRAQSALFDAITITG